MQQAQDTRTLQIKLDKAKAAVILDHPFFASILAKRKLILSPVVMTAGIDDRGTLYFNPDFIGRCSVPQLVWTMCHEVGHYIGQHFTRLGNRDKFRWNFAGDAWINDWLKEERIGEPVPNTVNMPGSFSLTVDEIYNSLPQGKGGKGGKGQGNGPAGNEYDNGLGDEKVEGEQPLTPGEAESVAVEVKLDVAEAAQVARMRGKLSANAERLVDSIINVRTPWHEILERFMVSFTNSEYSWKRPNKRFLSLDLYLPSVGKVPRMGIAVVEIDTSGSIDMRQLQHFGGHVNRVLGECLPEKLYVVYTDSKVCRVDVFTPDDFPITFTPAGGGGTDMREVFRWIEQEGIDPECVIILTDGYTPFPTEEQYPTVWAVTTDVAVPEGIGQVVRILPEDVDGIH